MAYKNKEDKRKNDEEYRKRPGMAEKHKKYLKIYNKEYKKGPEAKEAIKLEHKRYYSRPEIMKRKAKWQVEYHKNRKEKLAGRRKPKLCEICEQPGRICFDHDHKTNKFRGWICHRCNVILGLAQDNDKLLSKLVKYLEQNGISSR